MGILLTGELSIGTILFIAGLVILVYGVFIGGGKGHSKKDPNQLTHAAKMCDEDYAYKGSGRYIDKHGKVRYENTKKK